MGQSKCCVYKEKHKTLKCVELWYEMKAEIRHWEKKVSHATPPTSYRVFIKALLPE